MSGRETENVSDHMRHASRPTTHAQKRKKPEGKQGRTCFRLVFQTMLGLCLPLNFRETGRHFPQTDFVEVKRLRSDEH